MKAKNLHFLEKVALFLRAMFKLPKPSLSCGNTFLTHLLRASLSPNNRQTPRLLLISGACQPFFPQYCTNILG
jgi:hypothetical protein